MSHGSHMHQGGAGGLSTKFGQKKIKDVKKIYSPLSGNGRDFLKK